MTGNRLKFAAMKVVQIGVELYTYRCYNNWDHFDYNKYALAKTLTALSYDGLSVAYKTSEKENNNNAQAFTGLFLVGTFLADLVTSVETVKGLAAAAGILSYTAMEETINAMQRYCTTPAETTLPTENAAMECVGKDSIGEESCHHQP